MDMCIWGRGEALPLLKLDSHFPSNFFVASFVCTFYVCVCSGYSIFTALNNNKKCSNFDFLDRKRVNERKSNFISFLLIENSKSQQKKKRIPKGSCQREREIHLDDQYIKIRFPLLNLPIIGLKYEVRDRMRL